MKAAAALDFYQSGLRSIIGIEAAETSNSIYFNLKTFLRAAGPPRL